MPIEDPREDPTAVDWASTAIPVSFVIRNLRLSGSTVSSTAAENAPPLMPRTLQRMASDPMKVDIVRQAHMEKERNDVWHQAAKHRMKYVTFTICKTWSVNAIKNHIAGLKSASKFKPAVGEAHRVFSASADLLGEETNAEPWNSRPEWSALMWVTMEATTSASGIADIACLL